LTADQVKAIAAQLKSLNYQQLAAKNDPGIEDFEECFDRFKEFYLDAAKENDAVIVSAG